MLGRDSGRAKQTERLLRCSFCNKSQDGVRKLVAGPAVAICSDCVGVCVDIIADDRRVARFDPAVAPSPEAQARLRARQMNAEPPEEPPAGDALPDWHVRCGLCQMVVPTDAATFIADRGVLCDSCLAAVRDTLVAGRDGS